MIKLYASIVKEEINWIKDIYIYFFLYLKIFYLTCDKIELNFDLKEEKEGEWGASRKGQIQLCVRWIKPN